MTRSNGRLLAPDVRLHGSRVGAGRFLVIAAMAFLTVVDLFAAQALLPALADRYRVTPAAMSLAVNACTAGMAVGSLAVAVLSRGLEARRGIRASLILLSIPTLLLAVAPDLTTFSALRVVQGALMAAAFGLTLGYLGERYAAGESTSVFAAYVTGNVASNLFGRLCAAAAADHAGLSAAFVVFAGLNLLGALLAHMAIARSQTTSVVSRCEAARSSWIDHLRDGRLVPGFAIGFCILFAFIGTFTFVNFVLARPPLEVGMMQLGLVYLVFLPSIATTPLAGALLGRLGARSGIWAALGTAMIGLPLLVASHLATVLIGLVLVSVGTFAAQALATGYVSRTAQSDRAAASGIYLACYFTGGLLGTAILGPVFDHLGWSATVAGIAMSLVVAAALARHLRG